MKSQKLLVPINFDGLLTIAQFYARMHGVEWRYESRTYPPYCEYADGLKRLVIHNRTGITDENGQSIQHTFVVVEENPFAELPESIRQQMGKWDYDIEIRSYSGVDRAKTAASIPPWFVNEKKLTPEDMDIFKSNDKSRIQI